MDAHLPTGSGLAAKDGEATGVELGRVRLVGRAGEDIDLATEADLDEARRPEDPPPLCLQQSAGNSTRPQVDVVARILGHLLLDVDVGDLEASARP
jgi:hypothetical protein